MQTIEVFECLWVPEGRITKVATISSFSMTRADTVLPPVCNFLSDSLIGSLITRCGFVFTRSDDSFQRTAVLTRCESKSHCLLLQD